MRWLWWSGSNTVVCMCPLWVRNVLFTTVMCCENVTEETGTVCSETEMHFKDGREREMGSTQKLWRKTGEQYEVSLKSTNVICAVSVIKERGCSEKLVWRAWSLWKPALKNNNDDAENVVGNNMLPCCALWILDKVLKWSTLFSLMKYVGNVFIPSSIHQPVNALLPNNLLKQQFPWADTCLNIHKSTQQMLPKREK